MSDRITNDDKIGNWTVEVICVRRLVAHFQVRSLDDGVQEAHRIAKERAMRNLPTSHAVARKIIAKERVGRKLRFVYDKIQMIGF